MGGGDGGGGDGGGEGDGGGQEGEGEGGGAGEGEGHGALGVVEGDAVGDQRLDVGAEVGLHRSEVLPLRAWDIEDNLLP